MMTDIIERPRGADQIRLDKGIICIEYRYRFDNYLTSENLALVKKSSILPIPSVTL